MPENGVLRRRLEHAAAGRSIRRVTTPTPAPQPPRHDVALWAGAAAFFGSLLAVGIFDVFDADQWAEYLGALIVALITGAGVYSKERLDAAKQEQKAARGNATPAQ
jgi:hypothetical protein